MRSFKIAITKIRDGASLFGSREKSRGYKNESDEEEQKEDGGKHGLGTRVISEARKNKGGNLAVRSA